MRMKRKYLILVLIAICFAITGCDKSINKIKEHVVFSEQLDFSEDAVRYEFDSNNIFKYNGVIKDKGFVAYVFDYGSELVETLDKRKDMKVYPQFYSEESTSTENWILYKNLDARYLVIYCDSDSYDLEAGFAICNFLDENLEWDFTNNYKLRYSISGLENPGLHTYEEDYLERSQYYDDGKWSDVKIHYLINLDP